MNNEQYMQTCRTENGLLFDICVDTLHLNN